jgi:hypothetical protein
MVKLIEICELLHSSNVASQKYTLREIYINPEHIISLREEPAYRQKLLEGKLPNDLDSRQEFTRVALNRGHAGLEVVVVGTPSGIRSKLKEEKGVLHG